MSEQNKRGRKPKNEQAATEPVETVTPIVQQEEQHPPVSVGVEVIESAANPGSEVGQKINKYFSDISKSKLEVAKYKQEYMPLVLESAEQKDVFKKLEDAKRVLRKQRTDTEKLRKAINEPILELKGKIDAAAKEYTAEIVEVEEHVDAQIAKWEQWQEEEAARKKEEAERETKRRVDLLVQAGMLFDGQFYVLGDVVSMDVVSIATMKDFEFFLEKVKAEKKRLDEVAAEQARIAEQQRIEREQQEAKLKAEREEIEAENKRLQDERDKMNREMEQIKAERLNMREQIAVSKGLSFNPATMCYEFINKWTVQHISKTEMETLNNDDFNSKMKEIEFCVTTAKNNAETERKKQEAEAERERQAEQARKDKLAARQKQLMEIGMIPGSVSFYYGESENNAAIGIDKSAVEPQTDDTWPVVIETLQKSIKAEKEAAAIAKQREQTIMSQLSAMGMVIEGEVFVYRSKYSDDHVRLSFAGISDYAKLNNDIASFVSDARDQVDWINKNDTDEEQRREQQRLFAIPDIQRSREYIQSIKDAVANNKPTVPNASEQLSGILESFVSVVISGCDAYLLDIAKFEEQA